MKIFVYLAILVLLNIPVIHYISNFMKINIHTDNRAECPDLTYKIISYDCSLKPFSCEFNAKFVISNEASHKIFENLKIIISMISNDVFSFKIIENPKSDQYEYKYLNNEKEKIYFPNISYVITIIKNPFSLEITRVNKEENIFKFNPKDFIFSKKLIKFSYSHNNIDMFGLGQRFSPFKLPKNQKFLFWNKDTLPSESNKFENSYGSHPMYLAKELDNNFHIVFFNNINALSLTLNEKNQIEFDMFGGIIDIYFIFGDEYCENVIKKYHKLIGGYSIPPFFSLGYFQSRFGYSFIDDLIIIAEFHKNLSIPLEGFFLDIEYMNKRNSFTIDYENYDPKKINNLKTKFGLRIIPIIDPLIGVKPENEFYKTGQICAEHPVDKGFRYDVFLKHNKNEYFTGKQWVEQGYVPDMTHPNISKFLYELYNCLYDTINFDGIWIDMNEISIFGTEETNFYIEKELESKYPELNTIFPNYISSGTINLYLKNYKEEIEFNVHNLYSIRQSYITNNIVKKILNTSLPFILSRSNMFGSGLYANNWSGDNLATFEYLKLSIASIFNMNLFGIPMTGSDICGFQMNTNRELCARWVQLGSLYPFARNHNAEGVVSQEVYSLGDGVLISSENNLRIRYSLLKYYYSLFVEKNGEGTIFKPLFYNFPFEENCYLDEFIETQFMIGDYLMAAPILEEFKNSRKVFFPNESIWYNYHNGEINNDFNVKIIYNELYEPLPLFIRGGGIIFYQKTINLRNTHDLNDVYNLIIAIDYENFSSGKILGISNFNESFIYDYCIRHNCFVNFICNVKLENNIFIIEVKFSWMIEETKKLIKKNNVSFAKIKTLKFYGVRNVLTTLNKLHYKLNEKKIGDFNNLQEDQNSLVLDLPEEIILDDSQTLIFYNKLN